MTKTVAIGLDRFSDIIEGNYFYIDKTCFIKEWWENGDKATLITRPRRFGKTLTMSMVEQFYSVKYAGCAKLFQGLKIWEEEKYRELQGKYPVISLSFAGIKENSYVKTRQKICQLLVNLYADHRFLLEGDLLSEVEKEFFYKVTADMDDVTASMALYQLSRYLSNYYAKKVIILLDEYDTPMQEAYINGYWDEVIPFTRSFLNNTFKTNPYLERAIMTGITRVSKESVFSDLNNLEVVTATSNKYENIFGFTEEEVLKALSEYGLQDCSEDVRKWYDGFKFGNYDHIYNPWSIVNFLDKKKFSAYWAHTSSNRLVERLIRINGADVKIIMEDLLTGNVFHAAIDEEIIYSQLDHDVDAVWSLFLASGYIKTEKIEKNRRGIEEYTFSLTNLEARCVFDEIVKGWFSYKEWKYNKFTEALLSDNKEYMNEYLNAIALETFSSFDTGMKPSKFKQPENFYHGFVLGLIADLREIYDITSNRESGNGRYDVMMEPKDPELDDGIVLEFKVQETTEKSLEDTVRSAIRQIIDKKYAIALEAKGVPKDRIRIYGFAFRGKEVYVDGGLAFDG